MINNSPQGALLVSSGEKGAAAISSLLEKNDVRRITAAKTSGEARQLLSVASFPLVVINTPLSDEFGTQIAAHVAQTTCSGVMLIAKSDIAQAVAARTEDLGIITVAKPIDGAFFRHSVKLLTAMYDKFSKLESENRKLKLKLDEMRLVQRAKRMLMECLKMSESQAHHYIERQAMDMRVTKYEVANSIIRTYTDTY